MEGGSSKFRSFPRKRESRAQTKIEIAALDPRLRGDERKK
jgi:hypothetical protein